MNAHDLNTAGRTGTIAAAGDVPAIVDAGLRRSDQLLTQASAAPHTTNIERALRADRLAVLCARRARWWSVLSRWTYRTHTVPLVYGTAVVAAEHAARNDARFWTDTATDWRARAAAEPTSDAAGAMSNHHDLGIAA